MRKSLGEPVSVIYYFDAKTKVIKPYQVTWNNQDYVLGPIDFHHKTHTGGTLYHHFSMCDRDQNVYFRLGLNTDNLHWELEEVMMNSDRQLHYGDWGA